MHKAHVPLFKVDHPQSSKDIALANVNRSYDFVSAALADREYLIGDAQGLPTPVCSPWSTSPISSGST